MRARPKETASEQFRRAPSPPLNHPPSPLSPPPSPLPPSQAARAQQSLRAFTCLDEQEEACPRPPSPSSAPAASPGGDDLLLVHARPGRAPPPRSADGCLSGLGLGLGLGPAASPSSSAAADWGGDSNEDASPPASASSSGASAATALAGSPSPPGGAHPTPDASSPTLARALAALDLGGAGDGAAALGPTDLADALADWEAALAGVDGSNSPDSLPRLGDDDGEW